MSRRVSGIGPMDAKIVVVGEAPGAVEEAVGEPFVGASGNLQNVWWREVGIERAEVRIENLYEYRPLGNDIEGVDGDELAVWVRDLRRRVGELEGPCVIVPTGNYACFALTGKGKVKAALRKALGEEVGASEAERKAGIMSLRGSVYKYTDLIGRNCKVIPTIHPAWFLHGGGFNMRKQRRALADWKRIKRESASPTINWKPKVHVVNPTGEQIDEFVEYVRAHKPVLAVDVETWGNRLTCVGFAPSREWSITIPWGHETKTAVAELFHLAMAECEVVTHFGHYDMYWLASVGVFPKRWHWDTCAMHHCLHSTDEHTLHYVASIYCPEYRYWKDEAKDAEEVVKYARDLDSLFAYNGMDCCYTRELFDCLLAELVDADAVEFYWRHYAEMFGPLLGTMLGGVRVDVQAQKEWRRRLVAECGEARDEAERLAGCELYAKKDFSGARLRRLFYGTVAGMGRRKVVGRGEVVDGRDILPLNFPRQTAVAKTANGKVRRETLDEAALRKIAARSKRAPKQSMEEFERGKQIAACVLTHRRKAKLADFMKGAWDSDGRVRCQYKFLTEAGRLASSKNPRRTGYNLQNVDREIRGTFLPDEGHVLVSVDLSQVEDRIVKMWTRSPRLVRLANLHPEEYDCHTHNASIIFRKSEKDVVTRERYLAKRGVHAAERGMRGKKLADEILKDFPEMKVDAAACQRMIDAFLGEFHEIPEVYFKGIRQAVMRDRRLVSNWGRVWKCRYDRFDDDLYRRAYSFNPQADAADHLNQWGFKPLHNLLNDRKMGSRIVLQVHDEVVVSCPPGEAYAVAVFLVTQLQRPRYYFGEQLVVPATVTVGKSWADERYEFKRLPGEGRFNEVVMAVWEEMYG